MLTCSASLRAKASFELLAALLGRRATSADMEVFVMSMLERAAGAGIRIGRAGLAIYLSPAVVGGLTVLAIAGYCAVRQLLAAHVKLANAGACGIGPLWRCSPDQRPLPAPPGLRCGGLRRQRRPRRVSAGPAAVYSLPSHSHRGLLAC